MKIKPTETVTIDEVTYSVATLPDEIKSLVEVYDEIRKDHENAKVELIKCQTSLRELGNQIAAAIQKHVQEQTAASSDDDDEDDSRSRI